MTDSRSTASEVSQVPAELDIDPGSLSSAGTDELIQDCAVCCRPWRVLVETDEDLEPRITLLREDD